MELMDRIPWSGREAVLDVGCGDGSLTALIASRVPQGHVLGIDSSEEMIAHASASHPQDHFPNLRFRRMDARNIDLPARHEVVFSNATLHWVPDHRAFLRGAATVLRPGGRLVVSCGGHGNAEEVFIALRAEMRSAPWRRYFRNLERPYFFHGVEDYERWLPEAGFTPRGIRLAPKEAEHESEAAFVGWFRTTWMPYTHRVPPAERDSFIDAVVARYLGSRPADSNRRVHVRMVRLEIDAVRD
jgi:trans-aconitate methyltransferase